MRDRIDYLVGLALVIVVLCIGVLAVVALIVTAPIHRLLHKTA